MNNLLSMPSMTVGLMGRRPQQANALLEQLMRQSQEAAQFDAGDAYFTNPQSRPDGNGVPVLENGSVGYVAPTPGAAPAQRERVSGWRLLDRVLGGETITEGLDSERARLQAQADAPQQRARIEAALGSITDPRERALFLGLGGEDWQKNVAQQYAPQVIGAGGIQSVIGNGQMVGAPSAREFGDRIASTDPITGLTSYSEARAPSYQEETARLNATNPVTVAQDARLVDPYTGSVVAEGLSRPDIQNVAPGGEALAFDANGNIINRVGSTQVKPMSDADQAAVAKAEGTLATINTATTRAQSILNNIESGVLNLGPVSNRVSGALNAIGQSNPGSLAYDELNNWAKEARDAILAANTGVQTDQDAVRALDRIISAKGDENVVRQSVQRFIESQRATSEVLRRDVSRRSATNAPSAPPSNGPAVGSVEQGYRFLGGDPASPSSWERMR